MSGMLAASCTDRVQPRLGALEVPPPDRFVCRLDDQPSFLVPSRLCTSTPRDPGALRLNPDGLCFGQEPPSDWRRAERPRLDLHLGPQDEIVWVMHDVFGLLSFSVGPRVRALLEGLSMGWLAPSDLDVTTRNVLWMAQLLVDPFERQAQRLQWVESLKRCVREHSTVGFTPIAGLLHPFELGALRRYYRFLLRTGAFRLGDGQSPLRYAAHNERVARHFHIGLTETVSAVVGEPVKPSYVYFASYRSGAQLPRHTDRPQCEFSLSLLVDYSPEPEIESLWPLHLTTSFGCAVVYQAIGDALLYRGTRLPHERRPLPDNALSTSIFFHYVRRDFEGPLD
jgi:hypothetical protein